MRIGYARVSTEEQSLDLQLDALRRAGCIAIYTDSGISGRNLARPGLNEALRKCRPGDSFVVWRLDRLGRSLSHLVALISDFGQRNLEFISLTELINTGSASGMLMFHVMAALAEFERSLISERTRAGLLAARERGTRLGRRKALSGDQCEEAVKLLQSESAYAVADKFNVHPRTLKRAVLQHLHGIIDSPNAESSDSDFSIHDSFLSKD